jgi:uncharacterized iron-regulated protein
MAPKLKIQPFNLKTLWAASLGLWLLWSPPAMSQQVVRPAQMADAVEQVAIATMLADLATADVVYLGETHDRDADHAAQLEIIRALHQQHGQIAIAFEMFQRPFQPVIDQYLAGDISLADLRRDSEYDQRWGFPWANYAPILQFARDQQVPVLALNTPTEITRKVAIKGLDALTPREREWIPPLAEIRTDQPDYRRFLRPIYEDFHQDHGSSAGFESFFLAQVLWDETMAEVIAQFLTQHPERQVIVLTGQGHMVYGYGIPHRVDRRLPEVSQRLVLLNPSDEFQIGGGAIADYFWFSPSHPDQDTEN